MKQCPRCHQTYPDDDLNFCLNDGEFLTSGSSEPPPTIFGGQSPASDEPATILMDKTRVTNPTGWHPAAGPVQPWQQQTPVYSQPVPLSYGFPRGADQTLATVSLVLGIISLVAVCCYGGLWLGIPAAGVGFVALRNISSDPSRYGGRGLAIGGIVMGIVTAIITTIQILILIASILAG